MLRLQFLAIQNFVQFLDFSFTSTKIKEPPHDPQTSFHWSLKTRQIERLLGTTSVFCFDEFLHRIHWCPKALIFGVMGPDSSKLILLSHFLPLNPFLQEQSPLASHFKLAEPSRSQLHSKNSQTNCLLSQHSSSTHLKFMVG